MPFRVTKLGILVIFGGIIALGAVHLGIRQTLDSLLTDHATSTGMDWAHHIEVRVPDLVDTQEPDGRLTPGLNPDVKRFNDLISGILAVGNVHQIDFINSHCLCELTFGSHLDPKTGQQVFYVTEGGHNPQDGHAHATNLDALMMSRADASHATSLKHILGGVLGHEKYAEPHSLEKPGPVAHNHTPEVNTSHSGHQHHAHHQVTSDNHPGHTGHDHAKHASHDHGNHREHAHNGETALDHNEHGDHDHSGHGDHHPHHKSGEELLAARSHALHLDTQLMVDREVAWLYIQNNHHAINIVRDNPVQQADIYAEVYHPVHMDGEPLYMLRMIVGLDEKNTLFSAVLYSGAAFVLLIMLFSFAYPARKYFISSKSQIRANKKAHFLANHDVLTGISNRNAFQQTAPQLLEGCQTHNGSSYLMLIDVDRFKEINDFHGHQFGDEVLRQTARTLRDEVADEGFVARLGGDEFAVLMCAGKIKRDPETDDVIFPKSIQVSVKGGAQKVDVSLSCGVAQFPRDADNLSSLMQHADLALYAAKRDDDTNIKHFDADLGDAFKHRMNVLSEFKKALEKHQIVPFYQPLIGVESRRIEGFEALARWQHPDKGLLTPAYFGDIFADRDLSVRLGKYMMQAIMADIARWRAKGTAFESVGVNITEADLLSPTFQLDFIAGLSKHGLKRGDIAIEVTENCMFSQNTSTLIARLEELRNAGCFIALDDFGTGYSSITHLKNLPITAVKIDKSFIQKIVDDEADQAIVTSLVSMGKSLTFKMVAEGVETKDQLDVLKQLGCDLVQGFYYAPAVAAQDVEALIERINSDPANTRLKKAV